jgi:uncharacterized protein (UPF0297 family)
VIFHIYVSLPEGNYSAIPFIVAYLIGNMFQ